MVTRFLILYLTLASIVYAQNNQSNKRSLHGPSTGLEDTVDPKIQNQPRNFFSDDDFFSGEEDIFKQMQEIRKQFHDMMTNDPFFNDPDSFNKLWKGPLNGKQELKNKQYEDKEYFYIEIPKDNEGDNNFKIKTQDGAVTVISTKEIAKEEVDSKGNKSIQKSYSTSSNSFSIPDYVDSKDYTTLDQKDKFIIKMKKNKNPKRRKSVSTSSDDII